MQKKIETLEKKRDDLLQKLAGIGDMRRGSIYEHYRRCGKKQCELIEVNEALCDLRPLPVVKDEQELADLKKKLRKRFRKRSKGK